MFLTLTLGYSIAILLAVFGGMFLGGGILPWLLGTWFGGAVLSLLVAVIRHALK